MPEDDTTPLLSGARIAPKQKKDRIMSIANPGWASGTAGTIAHKMQGIFLSSYVNVLLVFVPLGFLAEHLGWSPMAVFTLNFFAIIPLAALLSFATEEISVHVGETVGGLLNATFGNAVELIVAIVALFRNELDIVKASMLGSILSNILLVMGCCFIAGGYNRIQQKFNQTVAQTMASMMALSVTSLLIPAAFNAGFPGQSKHVLAVSRGASIVILSIYVLYLYFQLSTHAAYFESQNAEASAAETPAHSYTDLESGAPAVEEEEEEHEQLLSSTEALILLAVVTLIVAFCADYLVASIDSIVADTGISKTFIGLILIPIVGNAAEHVTAIVVAMKDKMDLAVGVAIGSSLQIALFLTPFLVILGWIVGRDMSLLFTTFETCVLFVSVMIVNYIVSDGESNWLEGAMLIGTYTIIAIAFFYAP